MRRQSDNLLKTIAVRYLAIFISVLVFVFVGLGHCQVPVAQAPVLHFQFLNSSGNPLAGGKVFTYICGTTTNQNTYVDATGTVQNADPILLDNTGSPTNGASQTNIFLANLCYKFVAFDVNSNFQWSVDNVTTYFALTNSANTWSATQTFSAQIVDTLTDNQMLFGAPGNQTTLDAPPPAGNVTLHFPNTTDTLVGRATTDTLTNKTLTSPTINNGTATSLALTTPSINGTAVANSPGTYFSLANASSTGTTTNELVKVINAPSNGTISAITDTAGIVGICVSSCTNSGTAVIQASGTVSCVFDGGVTANDYVTISPNTAGNCHDAGSAYPALTQVVGRVLVTNASAGTYSIVLYGSDVKIPGSALGQIQIPNAGVTGTSTNTLTKITGSPATAVITAITDTAGSVGITTSGAGTTGNAQIQQTGILSCIFDGSTTADDYVQISSTTAGSCHDAGATYPVKNQVIGRVLSTNSGVGTYQLLLFGPEIRSPGGNLIQATTLTSSATTFTYPTAYVSGAPACFCTGYGGSCNVSTVTTTACTLSTLTVPTNAVMVIGPP